MKWPDRERDAPHGDAHLWLDASGRLGVPPDYVTQADDRFEAVCEELGILLARRVEPVSARVLPFGTEQLAMVQLKDPSAGSEVHAATARGASPAAAVAGAAINAVTGGRNVLAAALPGAVAQGKVRTAVVFSDGEAPVRWGLPDDETRLASLYAIVPHLGSFTATTDNDTYRVLRLPGIGVALVSEGQSAAAWVEGWFAALLQATQFALRATATPTEVVAVRGEEPPATANLADGQGAMALQAVEEECRRILAVAQEEAREIRESAEREARERTEVRRAAAEPHGETVHHASVPTSRESPHGAASTLPPDSPWRRSDEHRAPVDAASTVEPTPHDEPAPRDEASQRQVAAQDVAAQDVAAQDVAARTTLLAEAAREAERILRDAERTRSAVVAEAVREGERVLAEAERTRASARDDAMRGAEALLREAERTRSTLLTEAKREADGIVRDADRMRTTLLSDATRDAEVTLRDADRTRATVLGDAKREAESLLRETERTRSTLLTDARRETEVLLRDAERIRRDAEHAARASERTRSDVVRAAPPEPPTSPVATPAPAPMAVDDADSRRRDLERAGDVLIGEARRVADGIIHDARRSADELIRDATETRRQVLDVRGPVGRTPGDVEAARHEAYRQRLAASAPPRTHDARPLAAPVSAATAPPHDATSEAAAALLAAAAASVSAMSALLGRVQVAPIAVDASRTRDESGTSLDDLPGLYFGA